MFSMASLGANIDNSINNGRGPYVFRISGQIYHWIGSMCPPEGNASRFLQLYIYDTTNEVNNRMSQFGGEHNSGLKREIVEGPTKLLDNHNALVQLFRTARNKLNKANVPKFKVKLYNVVGTRRYELPTPETIEGYYKDMKLVNIPTHSGSAAKRMMMNIKIALITFDKTNKITRTNIFLYDAIMRGDRDGNDLGTRTVLTASFTGGPRYMYAHYLDALAICRVHGNPSFFITFTCNAKWPEIQEYMEAFPELTTADRADIVDRVFEQKVLLYTIEFQKRGLPHCHSLLWVTPASKIREDTDVDKYISAELPNPSEDPDGYRIISELMMHGPCGLAYKNAPCMKDGNKCNRNFPKPYSDNTYIDKDGFVHYRRRAAAIDTERQNTMLIKYLFKYISKGTDRVVANITTPIGGPVSTTTVQSIQIDEIRNFVEARYIGPHEACWRMLEFPIHYRDPAVLSLAVHLENMQHIQFRSKDRLQSIVDNPTKKKTTLTEWLEYNKHHTDGRHLTYLNFPSEYTWYATDKYWQRRRRLNKPVIGRLTYIHPSCGDLFYQRILLCHQKGCRSFRDIRTVNNVVYPTCRAACKALGLIGGDHEWIGALEEAALHASSEELRKLFVQILIFCDVSDPMLLWHKFWKNMSEDIPRRLAKILQISEIQKNETEMKAGVLFEIESILNSHSRTLKDFGLPMPPRRLLDILQNRILMEERNYDRELLLKEKDSLLPKLNRDQKQIFDEVLNGVSNQEQKLIFVYGHGGTGKTFLWKSLACALRSEERIVLAVASSGIASLLLPSGRTTHSRFKIPLNLHEECICSIKKNSQLADLLRECDLIIWDEAPMNDRRCFEALDRWIFSITHMLYLEEKVSY
ncbi:DNA helicase [Tanacetum coccineum]